MRKYKSYKYIFPPRPKNPIPPSDLDFWEEVGTLLAQPKLNGSNSLIFTNGIDYFIMNRHRQRLTNFRIDTDELSKIYRGDGEWMVINGEYMNKSKCDDSGNVFNHKLVIFDIIVYNGDYLIGSTFEERVDLLDSIYSKEDSELEYLYKITDNIYRVKTYKSDFKRLFNEFSEVDMLEGLVLKRANAKLEMALGELNNTKSQLKCRKSTKNYKF